MHMRLFYMYKKVSCIRAFTHKYIGKYDVFAYTMVVWGGDGDHRRKVMLTRLVCGVPKECL